MWFSLDPPERRQRRRPSHATVVAYLALIVAVVGGTGAAMAAGLIHTRNIANGAVTNPKIANKAVGNAKLRNDSVGNAKLRNDSVGNAKLRNDSVGPAKMRSAAVNHRILSNDAVGANNLRPHSVTRSKIRHGAVTGTKVAKDSLTGGNVKRNSLTGREIKESTLRMTRVAHKVTGGKFPLGSHPDSGIWMHVPYPLNNASYTQPAHSFENFSGILTVTFPASCTGFRYADLGLRENNRWIGSASVHDEGTGNRETVKAELWAEGLPLFPARPIHRTLSAHVWGHCGDTISSSGVFPTVKSFTLHVLRHQ